MSSDSRKKNRRSQPQQVRCDSRGRGGAACPQAAAGGVDLAYRAGDDSLRRRRALFSGAIVAAVLLAYANVFTTPFHFDDVESIVGNASIRDLSSFAWLRPPATGGETVSGRPVLNLSFALNHAVGRLDVRGYHLVNVLIHALAALVLFGIVRRTCGRSAVVVPAESRERLPASDSLAQAQRRPEASAEPSGMVRNVARCVSSGIDWRAPGAASLRSRAGPPEPSPAVCSYYEHRAGAGLACAVALLWALHPLHTGAVTYVVQRAESLAGLFYLLTLYGFIRAVDSDRTRSEWPQKSTSGAESARIESGRGAADRAEVGAQLAAPAREVSPSAAKCAASCAPTETVQRAQRGWLMVSLVCCLLGVATKETVATAPLLVLLYDRAFVAGSFRSAWRERWRYHLALAATWLVLGALVLGNPGRGGSAGLDADIGTWAYFLTQCEAIVHYLRLAVWPAGQVFDYGVATAGLANVWPQALLLLGLAGIGTWALVRNRASGFLIIAFFLLLAPSSSFVPVATQTIAEHRMYLPLAAVILLAGLAACALLARFARESGGPLRDRPDENAAQVAETVRFSRERPRFPAKRSRVPLPFLRESDTLPDFTTSGEQREPAPIAAASLPPLTRRATIAAAALTALIAVALGAATFGRNRVYQSALALWEDTVAKRPENPRAHHNLGVALLAAGRPDEALSAFRRAIALRPNHVFARTVLGRLLVERGEPAEAVTHLRAALAAAPEHVPARVNLGRALAQLGRADEAAAEYEAVLRVEPEAVDARTNLAALLLARGEPARAVDLLRAVVADAPELAEARYHLGLALEQAGRAGEAERELRAATELRPEWAEAQLAWANVLTRQGDGPAAERAYRAALAANPRLAAAQFGLGNVLARRREFAAAIDAYRGALQLDPEHVQARNNLANSLLVTGRLEEAIELYEQLLLLRPGDAAVRRNLELARELLQTSGR